MFANEIVSKSFFPPSNVMLRFHELGTRWLPWYRYTIQSNIEFCHTTTISGYFIQQMM